MSKIDCRDGDECHGEESSTERGWGGVGGVGILDQIRMGGLTTKVASEQRRCEVGEPGRVSGESLLGRGNCQCKGTEVKTRWEDVRDY